MEAHRPLWIRGPQLRQRWGDMPNSTFYDRLKRGLIPRPEYPFGPGTPYWRMDKIEAAEARAAAQAELCAAEEVVAESGGSSAVMTAPKRRGRPRKVQTTGVTA
jgi:hypothetical protein